GGRVGRPGGPGKGREPTGQDPPRLSLGQICLAPLGTALAGRHPALLSKVLMGYAVIIGVTVARTAFTSTARTPTLCIGYGRTNCDDKDDADVGKEIS